MVVVTETYHRMQPCCEASLFERATFLPDTAKSSYHLNDRAYFDAFPVEWKFTGGFEAPMAVYNYEGMQVKIETEFQALPVPDKHQFLDLMPHYPFSKKHGLFVAVTKKREPDGFRYSVHFFRHDDVWREAECLTGESAGQPLQYTADDDGLLLMQRNKLLCVSLSDFSVSTLYDAEERSLSNAHLTRCGKYIGVVTIDGDDAESLEFVLVGSSGIFGPYRKGKNADASLDSEVVLPLRVGNGMSEISFVPG